MLRSNPLAAVLALAAVIVILCGSSARAQTRPPARTAQREAAGKDPQQPPAAGRPQNPVTQKPLDAAPVPAGGAPGQSALKPGARVLAPQAPFVLNESQQKLLDGILLRWEQRSDKVNSFKCAFTRWDYDLTFGRSTDNLRTESMGLIKYRAPDHGDYSVAELKEWDSAKSILVPKTEGLDHWVCDGQSIFEFVPEKKQMVVRKLPAELQGKAIVDGPLPFVFGAKADQLKQRYWMRDVTRKQFIGKEVWLEAVPKRQQDAANFQTATIILTDPDFVPYGLQILLPDGKNKTVYGFNDPKINDPLGFVKGDFLPPITPLGWKKIIEPDPSEAPKASPPPAGEQGQAKRPAAATKRK